MNGHAIAGKCQLSNNFGYTAKIFVCKHYFFMLKMLNKRTLCFINSSLVGISITIGDVTNIFAILLMPPNLSEYNLVDVGRCTLM